MSTRFEVADVELEEVKENGKKRCGPKLHERWSINKLGTVGGSRQWAPVFGFPEPFAGL